MLKNKKKVVKKQKPKTTQKQKQTQNTKVIVNIGKTTKSKSRTPRKAPKPVRPQIIPVYTPVYQSQPQQQYNNDNLRELFRARENARPNLQEEIRRDIVEPVRNRPPATMPEADFNEAIARGEKRAQEDEETASFIDYDDGATLPPFQSEFKKQLQALFVKKDPDLKEELSGPDTATVGNEFRQRLAGEESDKLKKQLFLPASNFSPEARLRAVAQPQDESVEVDLDAEDPEEEPPDTRPAQEPPDTRPAQEQAEEALGLVQKALQPPPVQTSREYLDYYGLNGLDDLKNVVKNYNDGRPRVEQIKLNRPDGGGQKRTDELIAELKAEGVDARQYNQVRLTSSKVKTKGGKKNPDDE